MTATQHMILERYDVIFWGCRSPSSIHIGDPTKLFKWFDRRKIRESLERRVDLCLAQSRKQRAARLRTIALTYWFLAQVAQQSQPPAPRQLAFF